MMINLSNHPSSTWAAEQICAAHEHYGEIVDIPFPNIPPEWGHEEVHDCAWKIASEVSGRLFTLSRSEHAVNCPLWRNTSGVGNDECTCSKHAVHLMGETSFVVAFARYWRDFTGGHSALPLVCATTERHVVAHPDGTKRSTFRFVQFRPM